MTAAEWVHLAQEAHHHGLVFLLLTGGEVLLRADFFDVWEPLSRIGLALVLYTNGTLITSEVAERLAAAPPGRTEITLYGATEQTYERVTGIPGSYRRCREGIEHLLDHGVTLALKSTLSRDNAAEMAAMRDLAHSYGLTFNSAWMLTRRPDGARSEAPECRLAPCDGIALEAANAQHLASRRRSRADEAAASALHNFYCRAGRSGFAVDPTGAMKVCIDLPRPGVKPLEVGFAAAWQAVQQVVDQAPELSPECLACDARPDCARCPAWSLLETGTFNAPVPYLCEVARLRQEQRAADV